MTDFDRYASGYDAALAHALTVSGESKDYFARGRIAYLKDCLRPLHFPVRSVLDFGCGVGSGSSLLADMLASPDVLGVDVSARSIEEARRSNPRVRFQTLDRYTPTAEFDLAFCNGVFHHIPPHERLDAVGIVFRALRPGGLFALWENNPWNPGTRYVMAQCEFDRDAVMLSAPQARQLLRDAKFEIVHTNFLFIFPRRLGLLRGCERRLSRWPIGAQYQVLCQKPR
jgi:SAM-dependent methyltransferase